VPKRWHANKVGPPGGDVIGAAKIAFEASKGALGRVVQPVAKLGSVVVKIPHLVVTKG